MFATLTRRLRLAAEPVGEPLLASRRVRRFFLARLAWQAGLNALLYALFITVVEKTGSSVSTGLLVLCTVAPSILFGLVGGVVVDRLPKRLVLAVTGFLRALLVGLLIPYGDDVGTIYFVTLLFYTVQQFWSPAEVAAVPALVRREQLSAANTLWNVTMLAGQVVGLVLFAPLTIKFLGATPVYVVATLLLAAGAVLVSAVSDLTERLPRLAGRRRSAGWGETLARGWRFLRGDRVAFRAATELSLLASAMLIVAVLVPHLTEDVLDTSTENAVYLLAPAVVGLAVGLRTAPILARRTSNAALSAWGFFLFVGALAALGFIDPIRAVLWNIPPLVVFVLVAPAVGLAISLVNVAARTVLHERAPLEVRGQVFATQSFLASLTSLVPMFAAGAIADFFDVRGVTIGLAVVLLAAGVAVRYARWGGPVGPGEPRPLPQRYS